MIAVRPNLDRYERAVRAALGVFAIFAGVFLFQGPLARGAAGLFGAFALWEAAAGYCYLHGHLGARSPSDRLPPAARYLVALLAVQLIMAYEWWMAGLEKLMNPQFLVEMPKTLGYFASKNPFPSYKAFLMDVGIKYAQQFGIAVEWGQVLVALTLAAAAVLLVLARSERHWKIALGMSAAALLAGMAMNANFYFAAGWTGPGTKGSNVVMFWTQAILLYAWLQDLIPPKKSR